MRWKGGEQSENFEDRRGKGSKGLALGGGGVLVIIIVGLLLGSTRNRSTGSSGRRRISTLMETRRAQRVN